MNINRYVKILKNYIDVDIIGKCGPIKCEKDNFEQIKECNRMVERDYKFYLAFENSACDDYVTEKMFR